jgi:hypothetical protein
VSCGPLHGALDKTTKLVLLVLQRLCRSSLFLARFAGCKYCPKQTNPPETKLWAGERCHVTGNLVFFKSMAALCGLHNDKHNQ